MSSYDLEHPDITYCNDHGHPLGAGYSPSSDAVQCKDCGNLFAPNDDFYYRGYCDFCAACEYTPELGLEYLAKNNLMDDFLADWNDLKSSEPMADYTAHMLAYCTFDITHWVDFLLAPRTIPQDEATMDKPPQMAS